MNIRHLRVAQIAALLSTQIAEHSTPEGSNVDKLKELLVKHAAAKHAAAAQEYGDKKFDRRSRGSSVIQLPTLKAGEARWFRTKNGVPGECRHGFGLAGGFSECAACGVKVRDSI